MEFVKRSNFVDQIAIIHYSDLHFGPVLANDQFGFNQGFAAHDFFLCQAMPLALEDLRNLFQLRDDEEWLSAGTSRPRAHSRSLPSRIPSCDLGGAYKDNRRKRRLGWRLLTTG